MILAADAQTAECYAQIRHTLETQGRRIPMNDLWIAAIARQHQLPILSPGHPFRRRGKPRTGFLVTFVPLYTPSEPFLESISNRGLTDEVNGLSYRFSVRGESAPDLKCSPSCSRSKLSRSSGRVNISTPPAAARGHSSRGRSQYSSTPFSSGSRRQSACAHPVVRRAVERDTCADQALKRVSQLRARWIENREMIESSGAWRRRRPAETLPRIQADMVMIPARRNECRTSAVTLGELETEDAAVESQGALQICHFQVHMADSHVGMNRLGYRALE